jgi:hypothetical protein
MFVGDGGGICQYFSMNKLFRHSAISAEMVVCISKQAILEFSATKYIFFV